LKPTGPGTPWVGHKCSLVENEEVNGILPVE